MGRWKLVIKPIEDKNRRQATFSKRRNGLIKKADELSVLCQVDVALLVFSRTGKFYQFCSGGSSLSDIMSDIMERYDEHFVKADVSKDETGMTASASGHERLWSNEGLLQRLQRHLEGVDTEKLDLIDIVQLEKLLDSMLLQTRTRKTQLLAESAAALYNNQETTWREEGNHKLFSEEMTQVMSGIGCLNELDNPHQVATFRWMGK